MLEPAAAVAALFNLVCSGTLSTTQFSGETEEPYRYEYRIDLAAGKWCDGDCRALRDIAEVQPATLTLEPNRNIETPDRREFFSGSIDRETGRQSMLSTSGRGAGILILRWEGTCERAPFAGFPAVNARF